LADQLGGVSCDFKVSGELEDKGLCVPNHLVYKLLSCWLFCVEESQESEQLALVSCIGHELCLLIDVDEEDAEVTPRSALLRLQ
jgi:hypothetical protein